MSRLSVALAAGLIVGALATPAVTQFDPLHNNLKCYKINGPSLGVSLQLDNQFGRERVFKLVPQFLCLPTQKTCCDPAQRDQCVPKPCNPEPSPNQPAPVDHFKCYKIQVKQCTPTTGGGFDCSKLTGRFPPAPPAIAVTLRDQFHDEDVTVGPPKMLCVPVLKIRQGTTTTTTQPVPTTTTTTIPCHFQPGAGGPGVCAGDCPPPLACVNVGSPTMPQCTCETPCGMQGAACTGFCPGQAQQCATTPTIPCGCCSIAGAPCASNGECCSNTCNAATLTCQ